MNANEYQKAAQRTDLEDYKYVRERLHAPNIAELVHAAMGMATEAAEFTDALKKHLMYGKPLDRVNLAEEVADCLWYCALAANTLGVKLEDIMQTNIDKLKARYPEKFTEANALARDLAIERKILEGGNPGE